MRMLAGFDRQCFRKKKTRTRWMILESAVWESILSACCIAGCYNVWGPFRSLFTSMCCVQLLLNFSHQLFTLVIITVLLKFNLAGTLVLDSHSQCARGEYRRKKEIEFIGWDKSCLLRKKREISMLLLLLLENKCCTAQLHTTPTQQCPTNFWAAAAASELLSVL